MKEQEEAQEAERGKVHFTFERQNSDTSRKVSTLHWPNV